jgi:hypothetical protein
LTIPRSKSLLFRFLTTELKKLRHLTLIATGRRCLTEPAGPVSNHGFDNTDDNLIVHAGDVIIDPGGPPYSVTHLLGKGEFGQVFAVALLGTDAPAAVALKITNSSPSHRQQTAREIAIMERLRATGTRRSWRPFPR